MPDQWIQQNIANAVGRTNGGVDSFVEAFSKHESHDLDMKIDGKSVTAHLNAGQVRGSDSIRKINRKHVIDGGTAYDGGFTVDELNRDIGKIKTSATVTKRQGEDVVLAYPVTGARGIDWVVVISNIDGEPHVRSIHTTRRQNDTRSIRRRMYIP